MPKKNRKKKPGEKSYFVVFLSDWDTWDVGGSVLEVSEKGLDQLDRGVLDEAEIFDEKGAAWLLKQHQKSKRDSIVGLVSKFDRGLLSAAGLTDELLKIYPGRKR